MKKIKEENPCIKRGKLPTERCKLGFFKKRELKKQGVEDGNRTNAFEQVDVPRLHFISNFMRREIDEYCQSRDDTFSKEFICYRSSDGQVVRSATFIAWCDYMQNRIDSAEWRNISAGIRQGFSGTKNIASKQVYAHRAYEERKQSLTKLCDDYLTKKINMIHFVEEHLRPVLTYRLSRIQYYYEAAAKKNTQLLPSTMPNVEELFQGMDFPYAMREFEIVRQTLEDNRSNVRQELAELTPAKMSDELNEALISRP